MKKVKHRVNNLWKIDFEMKDREIYCKKSIKSFVLFSNKNVFFMIFYISEKCEGGWIKSIGIEWKIAKWWWWAENRYEKGWRWGCVNEWKDFSCSGAIFASFPRNFFVNLKFFFFIFIKGWKSRKRKENPTLQQNKLLRFNAIALRVSSRVVTAM